MTKLAILATLTNFILPTSFFELYHSNFGGSITTIICAYRSFQTLNFFHFWCALASSKYYGYSYRRSNTPTVIGLKSCFCDKVRVTEKSPKPGRFFGNPGNVSRQAIKATSPSSLFHSIPFHPVTKHLQFLAPM